MAKLKRRPLGALDDLVADNLRHARDLFPAIEWAQEITRQYDFDSLSPLLKTIREQDEMIRRATESLTIDTSAVEAMKSLTAVTGSAAALKALDANSAAMEMARSVGEQTETLNRMKAVFDVSPALTEAAKALTTDGSTITALRAAMQVDAFPLAWTEPLKRQIEFASSLKPVFAASGVLDDINKLSGLSAQWRSAFEGLDKIKNLLPADAFDNVTRLTESFRTAMPTAPLLDPSLFGGEWDETLADAVERLRQRAERLAADPDPDVDDIAAVVAAVEAASAAAPPAARARLNLYLIALAWWLLDKAFEDPAKELIRDAWGALLIVLGTLAPAPPTLPAPPPAIIAPALDGPDALLTPGELMGLPAIIQRAGPAAEARTLEFLAGVRNRNTRDAYVQALVRFTNWCEGRELELSDITVLTVNAYFTEIARDYKAATLRQHLAAIRLLFDHLVAGGIVPVNPASDVRVPNEPTSRRRAAALQPQDIKRLLDSIDASELSGLRDRALIGVMVYGFARVSPLVAMDVKDCSEDSGARWFSLRDEGGVPREVPAHPKAHAYVQAYLDATGLTSEPDSPLWRTMAKDGTLSDRRMSRMDVYRAVRRRADDADVGALATCQNLRAAGLTAYLANGGSVRRAQIIAAHASARTTKRYEPADGDEITAADIEKIRI